MNCYNKYGCYLITLQKEHVAYTEIKGKILGQKLTHKWCNTRRIQWQRRNSKGLSLFLHHRCFLLKKHGEFEHRSAFFSTLKAIEMLIHGVLLCQEVILSRDHVFWGMDDQWSLSSSRTVVSDSSVLF